ncbi:hypothetical protein ACIP5U_37400 [Streptomyces sp. NPDC088788]|uniref:hypothetical protein n=1 Tax=Streptomyces sp. NPDC088788 TaxID=3365898 RepID=UPI0037F1CDA3
MTDDGVIRYRQTRNHSTLTLTPDRTSGILINRPSEQVTAPAYLMTGPNGTAQLWRAQAVQDAITRCLRKPPCGWPAGWAHLRPDASIEMAPGGFPWTTPDIYTAVPANEPDQWGAPCGECKSPIPEGDLSRLWPHADGYACICWADSTQA